MNADGTGKKNLTEEMEGDTRYSSFSPDGKKILFYFRPLGSENYSLWIMNADGTGKVNLNEVLGMDVNSAVWYP